MGALLAGLVGRADDAQPDHPPAEVPLVDRLLEDRLVDALQLPQREAPGQEAVGHVRVGELVPQPRARVFEDALVPERERFEVAQGVPGGTPLQIAPQPRPRRRQQREVRHDDARVSLVRLIEAVELLQEHVGEAGLVLQLAAGRPVERLVWLKQAPRQRPLPLAGLRRALDQEHGEPPLQHGEDDHDHRGRHPASVGRAAGRGVKAVRGMWRKPSRAYNACGGVA